VLQPAADSSSLLVVLYGPTASGKTALAIALAQALGSAILCADSRQVYREMDIGTAKPTKAEQAAAQHWGLDLVAPDTRLSAPAFAEYALARLPHYFAQNRIQIACGGTGFYLKALCEGLDAIPESDPVVRAELSARLSQEGLPALVAQLQAVDPALAARIDLHNPRRVQRALEVFLTTGRPLSEWQQGATAQPRPFRCLYLSPRWPREVLHARIAARVDQMLVAGLVAEVAQLMARYGADCPGLQAIGYAETVAHLQGKLAAEALVPQIVAHTRQYAKRQVTWLRQLPAVHLLDMTAPDPLAQAFTLIAAHA
jgi:tRNA dimethylallyltransferase